MALRVPAFNDAKTYGFEWLRLLLEASLQEGAIGAGDFKVTAAAAGAPLRVDVAVGSALVKGDSGIPGSGLSHGLYLVVNDAAIANAVSLTAAHATLPRIDQIVLRVRDTADLGSASDTAALEAITGTATGGATLDNRTGAAALTNDSLRLADVLVPAAATAVIAGNVRDRRPWARGFHAFTKRTSATSTTSATPNPIDTTALQVAGEFSGVPITVRMSLAWQMANAAYTGYIEPYVDAAAADGMSGTSAIYSPPYANLPIDHAHEWDFVPAAGHHKIALYWRIWAGAGTTMSLDASTNRPALLAVEESIRPSAQNT